MSDLTKIGPDWGGTGTFKPFTSAISGAQRVADAHGRYFDTASRKQVFFAATQAGQTTSAGLALTYVGICLSNPVGSPVNLVVNKIGWAFTVIAAAVNNIALAVGYNPSANVTHTVALSPQSSFIGSQMQPVAKADTSATLPTAPVYYMFLNDTPTATTNPNGGTVDLEGSLVLPAGGYMVTATAAASSAAAFWASVQWEEVPALV